MIKVWLLSLVKGTYYAAPRTVILYFFLHGRWVEQGNGRNFQFKSRFFASPFILNRGGLRFSRVLIFSCFRISFKSPSTEKQLDSKEDISEQGMKEKEEKKEEKKEEEKEAEEHKKRREKKRKRPRDNILCRVDMHHNIKR